MTPSTEKIIKQFKKSKLTTEDRVAILTALLEKIEALPIGDMIVFSKDGLLINGKELTREQADNFKESVMALNDNVARKIIHEQIRYKATEQGIHKSTSIEGLLFAKAIIWCLNEENILISHLSTG